MNIAKRLWKQGPYVAGGSIWKALVIVASLAMIAAACAEDSEPEGPVTIRFSFDWKQDGDWAPLIWADELGYFDEEGIAVEWMEGDGSSAVLPLLGAGELDIAQISAPPLVLSVPEGIPLTVVGVQGTGSPNVFICDPSIKTPAGLAGKTYADQVGEFEHGLWLAWVEANDVDIDAVNVVPATGESGDVLFLAGELDCYIDFWTSGAVPEVMNAREGEESLFFVRDSLDIYGQSTAVNNDFLAENPERRQGIPPGLCKGCAVLDQQSGCDHSQACRGNAGKRSRIAGMVGGPLHRAMEHRTVKGRGNPGLRGVRFRGDEGGAGRRGPDGGRRHQRFVHA